MDTLPDRRLVALMVDYLFGKGVSRALPRGVYKLIRSRRSGRVKQINLDGKLFAVVKPNGAIALSIFGAQTLSRSPRFKDNCVQVSDDVTQFVQGGRSVFCKFVTWSGKKIYPKSEVAVVDGRWKILGVGMAVLNGAHMKQFKSGTAVKVRSGIAA
jgi:predicted RNA-binding protein (TIGR00451 family)